MAKERYRLQALLVIKEREKNRAAEVLARSIKALHEAREKEKKLVKERDEIIERWHEARNEMRRRMDCGAVIKQGNVHVNFMRKLKEDEEKKNKEIEEQREIIAECEDKVARARRDYIDAAKEHQVMIKHKDLWKKKLAAELTRKEELEFDELGNTIHHLRKWKGEKSNFTM